MSLETRQKEGRDRRVERTRWAADLPPPRGSWQRLLMEGLGERGLLARVGSRDARRGLRASVRRPRRVGDCPRDRRTLRRRSGARFRHLHRAGHVPGSGRVDRGSRPVGPRHRRAVCGRRSLSNVSPSSRPLRERGGRDVGCGCERRGAERPRGTGRCSACRRPCRGPHRLVVDDGAHSYGDSCVAGRPARGVPLGESVKDRGDPEDRR